MSFRHPRHPWHGDSSGCMNPESRQTGTCDGSWKSMAQDATHACLVAAHPLVRLSHLQEASSFCVSSGSPRRGRSFSHYTSLWVSCGKQWIPVFLSYASSGLGDAKNFIKVLQHCSSKRVRNAVIISFLGAVTVMLFISEHWEVKTPQWSVVSLFLFLILTALQLFSVVG